MSLILARSLLGRRYISRGEGKESASLNLSEGHIGVGHEVVELVHEVLGDKVRQTNQIVGVTQNRHEHLLNNAIL